MCQLDEEKLQDFWFQRTDGDGVPPENVTQCRRELIQAIWRKLMADPEFREAYRNGIVVKCWDGIERRLFPRIFTYSADYPEAYVASYY